MMEKELLSSHVTPAKAGVQGRSGNRLFLWLWIPAFAGMTMVLLTLPAHAAEELAPQLPIPRFVTLSTDEVNLRTGPGLRYPVKIVLKKDGLPVQIVKEFDVWRQVVDRDGDEGWVHKSMLSGRRSVIITGPTQTLFKKPDEGTKPIVKLEPGVIANLDRCDPEWCYLKIASYKGWIKRDSVWGVYPEEKFTE